MDYTVTSLLNDIRRIGSIPSTSVTGTQDSDLLACANDSLQLSLSARIIAAREGFYRQYYDHAISSSTRYQIPGRAVGNRLAAVLLIDGNGNTVRKLNELNYSDLTELNGLNDTAGYILEADTIQLVPAVPSSNIATIRMVYYICPNALSTSLNTAGGQCFTVTAVSGNVVTLMASHGLLTSTRLDVIRGQPPFAHMQIDVYPTAVDAITGTVTLSDASGIVVGDFICKAEFAPRAQIPDAMYPLLAHVSAMDVLKSIGDLANHKRLAEELPKLEADVMALISPRVEQGAKKIMSNSSVVGALSWAGRRRYWGA